MHTTTCKEAEVRKRSKTSMYFRVLTAVEEVTDSCIHTPTGLDSDGYGQLRDGMGMTKAHKLAYTAKVGEIPAGLLVRHTCDNRACINPKHLLVGTVQDNYNDMKERGRAAVENNAHAKLNWIKVREIRASSEAAEILAERYGVATKQVNRILRGEQWLDN